MTTTPVPDLAQPLDPPHTEQWPGPNGGTWQIHREQFPPMVPVKGVTCVCAQTLQTLRFVDADGEMTELFSDAVCVGGNHDYLLGDSWVRMCDTARRQTTAPVFMLRPREGTAVRILSSGEDGKVNSHCIHDNAWRGPHGECHTRGEFSAFVVELPDRRVVAYPDEVKIVLVIEEGSG